MIRLGTHKIQAPDEGNRYKTQDMVREDVDMVKGRYDASREMM